MKISHLPAFIARLLPFIVQDIPFPLIDVMLSDSVADPKNVVTAFDL